MIFQYDGIWFISFFSTLLTYESNMNRKRQFGVLMIQLLVLISPYKINLIVISPLPT